jgi:hypothetical protein
MPNKKIKLQPFSEVMFNYYKLHKEALPALLSTIFKEAREGVYTPHSFQFAIDEFAKLAKYVMLDEIKSKHKILRAAGKMPLSVSTHGRQKPATNYK